MFSLPKILALIAIVGAVWYGFKFITRLDHARKDKVGDDHSARTKATEEKAASASKIEDLVECKTCGTFVAAGSKPNCGQGEACPFA